MSASGQGASSTPAARLCASCGMCCDGVLFHAVDLQTGDSPRQLSSLGLKIRRKKGREYFLQPCQAHRESDGVCSCEIYGERPGRCRLFNCRQLLGVASGAIDESSAMTTIREARERVAEVNAAIAKVGETNPNRSLSQRVSHALTTKERNPLHDDLEASMAGLEALLEKEFRVQG